MIKEIDFSTSNQYVNVYEFRRLQKAKWGLTRPFFVSLHQS